MLKSNKDADGGLKNASGQQRNFFIVAIGPGSFFCVHNLLPKTMGERRSLSLFCLVHRLLESLRSLHQLFFSQPQGSLASFFFEFIVCIPNPCT